MSLDPHVIDLPPSSDHGQQPAHTRSSWARSAPVPSRVGTGGLVLVLESLRALSAVRREVRTFLTDGCGSMPGVLREDALERAVLVIDELTSNALRHGLQPSSLQVCDEPARWLVIVRDAAPSRLPEPAVNRPAGQGGYGLYVIADLTADRGVHYAPDHKLVWACLAKPDLTTAREPGGVDDPRTWMDSSP